MKKLFNLSIALLLLSPSILALPVHAVSDENVTRRRKERAVQIQEIKQDRQEFRDQVAANHASRLERRFTFYFDRLTGIITRFQARLDKLKTGGKDVSAIQTKLDAAKTKLAEAKTKGESAVSAFRAIDPAKFSEQKTAARAARDLAQAARVLFKEAHNLLKDALKSLKTISKPALPAASPAVQNAQ